MTHLAMPLRRGLPFAFGGYVLIAVALHLLLPTAWTWQIAYAALIGMLFTYPVHALVDGRFERQEILISLAFAATGLIGLLFAPLLLIAAIAAHGVLDFVKYLGVGVRVPAWYLIGCAVFDLGYAAFLFTWL